MVINWTNPSIKDLKDFASFTKMSNPYDYLERLIKKIDMLKEQPKSGKIFFYIDDCIIRQIVIEQHKVLYYINNDTIHILAVIHYKQDMKEKVKHIKQYLNS